MIIKPRLVDFAILVFIGLILLLLIAIMLFMQYKIKQENKRRKWKLMADLLIRKAIFLEEEENVINDVPITSRTKKLLKDAQFRKLLTQELINAKKNISGIAAENLKHLYLQLGLHQYALTKLKNYKWHIKAQAIQELAIMNLKEHVAKIYRFTNNNNELVRMEAQIAVVKFYGFEGLRFLDVISYPVSEWQQIKLLQELQHIPPENFNGIEKWFKSKNKSVIVFALKLARNYHRFELHDDIISCLKDEDANVRLQAIYSLGEIYNDETSAYLIGRYLKEDIKHQMAIVKVLQSIATNDDIPPLLDQLDCEDAELKRMVARALANISPVGFASLQNHAKAGQYPLNDIIAQIKGELAA